VIGCSIAWHLRRSGANVTVVERARIGDGASSAAAGMLAPFSESSRPGPFAQLSVMGLESFIEQAEQLSEESGIDFELRRDGILRIAESAEQAAALRAALPWQQQAGADAQWIEPHAVASLEPGLRASPYGAVYSSTEGHVNPLLLSRALAAAASVRGVRLLEHCSVEGFDRQGDGIVSLRSSAGRLPVEHLVLAGGAWTGGWSEALGVDLPVFPVRGQMAALSQPTPTLRHIIYSADGYLVPKSDGSVFVGATEEEDAGFDASVTVEGLRWLLSAATRLVPGLAAASFLRSWAGLRPCTADRLPLIGPLPGLTNVTLATGHFRNGILLSLITGRLVAELILKRRTPVELTTFLPERPIAPF